MRSLIVLLAFFAAAPVSAQVNFENISIAEAISRSAASGKLVFAQFVSESCDKCNQDADRSFAIRSLGESINRKCIAIKIEINSPDREHFIASYNFNEVPGTFFISGDGQLVHKFTSTTAKFSDYITQVDRAYKKITERKAILKELDNEWNRDPSDILASEANIEKRADLSLPIDSLL